jgi:3-hydroxybutyryl-CoA dehydrogenase
MSADRETLVTVGVVGAGTMGAGIAQLALEAGHEVVLHDVDEAAIARGRDRVRDGLARRAARLDLDGDSIDEWVDGRLAGLRAAVTLDAVGAEAQLVIEAALEDLELKQTVFAALDAAAAPDVVLATNTSALSVGAIAARTTQPKRVLGLHFFNPAPVMPLVEVVAAARTAPEIVERAMDLMLRWGKTPVRCADTPGFIVNRVNRPFTLEALRFVESGLADVPEIDAAMRAAGFPMGPFELMDLVGLDVNLSAAQSIWEGLGRPERLRPSPVQGELVAAGDLGRKTGRGFYRYDESGQVIGPVPARSRAAGTKGADAATIVGRIRAAIEAEASLAVADGVASAADIALGLRLGAGHPATLTDGIASGDRPARA